LRKTTLFAISIVLTMVWSPSVDAEALADNEADPVLVFVSIPPQKFIVEQLAGALVSVEVLLPPGASPATYEPTPRQMARLDHAALYFQIGAPFEGPLLAKMAVLMPHFRVIDCRQGVELDPLSAGDHAHSGVTMDPHIWLDPERMKIIAATSRAALGDILQDSDSDLDRNLDLLLDEIDLADAEISAVLDPFEGREVLVFHPAYGYFTRRYGLRQMAVETEGRAPSARRLASVLATFEGSAPPAIFIQPQFSSSAAQTIADALGCGVVELDPLAEDYLVNLRTMAARIATVLEG